MKQRRRLLKAGALVLCHSYSKNGRIIAPFSRSKGEMETWCTHVGMMMTESILIEAARRTVYTKLESYPDSSDIVVVCPTFLTKHERVAMFNAAKRYKGKKYGWPKILAHATDYLFFSDKYVMRRLCRLDNYPICSYIVAKVYHEVLGYSFGVPYMQAQPDDIADHCRAHPEHWKICYHNTREGVARYINGSKEYRDSDYDETLRYQSWGEVS